MDISNEFLTLADLSAKVTNSLIALAMSDALGGPAEFRARGTFPHIDTMIRNENFNLPPGTWTDDTSMTLCLGRAIIDNDSKSKPPTQSAQAELYLNWYRNGYLSAIGKCFDIGITTRTALKIWESGKPAKEALQEVKNKLSRTYQCGNGSLMRVLPVSLVYWKDVENAMYIARESSDVSHPNEMCRDACAVYTLLVSSIITHNDRKEAMSKQKLLEALFGYNFKSAGLRDAVGPDSGFLSMQSSQIKTSGYVVHTLRAALWVFFHTKSYEEGAICVVNMGGDADTVAAVYGGLAGSWYADAFEVEDSKFWTPRVRNWWENLAEKQVVEKIAGGLCKVQS